MSNSPTFDWHVTNLRNYVNLSVTNVPPVDLAGIKLPGFGPSTTASLSSWLVRSSVQTYGHLKDAEPGLAAKAFDAGMTMLAQGHSGGPTADRRRPSARPFSTSLGWRRRLPTSSRSRRFRDSHGRTAGNSACRRHAQRPPQRQILHPGNACCKFSRPLSLTAVFRRSSAWSPGRPLRCSSPASVTWVSVRVSDWRSAKLFRDVPARRRSP